MQKPTEELPNPKEEHELESIIDLLLDAEAEGGIVQIKDYVKTNGEVSPLVEFYFPTETYFQLFWYAHCAYERALRELECGDAFMDISPEDSEGFAKSKEWKKVQDKIFDVLGEASKTGREDKYKSQGVHNPSSESAIRRYGLGQRIMIPDENSIILKGVLFTKGYVPEPTEAHAWIKWSSGLGRYRNLELRPGRFSTISTNR